MTQHESLELCLATSAPDSLGWDIRMYVREELRKDRDQVDEEE